MEALVSNLGEGGSLLVEYAGCGECVFSRHCPIMLKILPISLVSKSHALYLLVFNYYPLVSIKIINENYTATSQTLLHNLLRNYIHW